MIQTLMPQGMKKMERRFMDDTGFPGLLLMENAARAAHETLCAMAEPGGRVLFACGPGNNGGDGLAMARLWKLSGGESLVWLLGRVEELPVDAMSNVCAAQAVGVEVLELPPELPELPPGLCAVVDALFGTGLSRPLKGPALELTRRLRASGLPSLAVDIPSGIDGATGEVMGAALPAVRTITFHRPKPGHFLGEGRLHTGELILADIGIPPRYDRESGYTVLEPSDLARMMPRRGMFAHKGQSGRLLVIAGSLGMAGAAAFCAGAATRAGAGLVTVACPQGIVSTLQALVPEAMVYPLPEEQGALAVAAAEEIEALLPGKDVLALGPGLSRRPGVMAALRPALACALPKVVDADALFVLPETPGVQGPAVLTPHPGEMAHLTGDETGRIAESPVGAAQSYAARYLLEEQVLLLKGATTVLAQRGDIALNVTGHPCMAGGGSGDVLTGVIAAFLAQGLSPWDASRLGALAHGLAGQAMAEETGTLGGTPWALMENVAGVLRRAEKEKQK